ncbi:MAG TPA: aminoacyl--tRNA ligase-related protein [Tepidisphaeraceae bacterium]|jgi:prolyl-tRNA synthetase
MAKNIKARKDDYAQWYLDVIKAAQLADYSPVRGCMVIRPEGFSIWEAIQRDLDRRFKETGHVNAYFPLLIPQSFLTKEAEHVEGFALECAIVTHSKFEKGPDGKLKPAGELEEPLVIRPTSETMIGHMYAQWIQSYRDLPILINQWCNVMRWEMRTRLFLRTSEFLWQEGHTAHETADEANVETLKMLDVYADFAEEALALPVVKGRKTDSEKFPGAVTTYCIEALMQDGKALQAGTSHDLGQNFAKAFEIKYLGRDNTQQYAWTTSWGVSTRLIGAMIMAHSDDDGLVVPPRVAPIVAVIIPVFKNDDEGREISKFIRQMLTQLVGEQECTKGYERSGPLQSTVTYVGQGARFHAEGDSRVYTSEKQVEDAAFKGPGALKESGLYRYFFNEQTFQQVIVDWRDVRPGDKQFHWEQRGVPFRFEVGPRDVASGVTVLKRRLDRVKETLPLADVSADMLRAKLEEVHALMLEKARVFRDSNTRDANSYDDLKRILEADGGFVRCYFDPDAAAEAKLKTDLKATVRCVPFEQSGKEGLCVHSGKPTTTQVLIAQAY